MAKAKTGSCLCGVVEYEFLGRPFSFNHCHCRMCQKFSGAAFGSYIGIEKNAFRFVQGEEKVKSFDSSDWACRIFCSECGSSLFYYSHELPEHYFIAAGTIDGDPGIEPKRHVFVKDKISWHSIMDDLPQIERYL
jgi:hypothetical protein